MTRSLCYDVEVLGFTNAEWGGADFTCVSRDGANIYLSEGDQGQPATCVWLGVEDVEAASGIPRERRDDSGTSAAFPLGQAK
jgi:sugar lactone lactonase YvrE